MKLTCLGRYGPYPAPLARTSSYLVQTQSTALWMDCGAGAMSHLGAFLPVEQVEALLLSHLHVDHVSDVRVLSYYQNPVAAKGGRKLPVYLPATPAHAAQEIAAEPGFEAVTYDGTTALTLRDCTVEFYRTVHPVECYAMRLKSGGKTLVYSADNVFDEQFVAFCQGADLLLCDAAFDKGNQPDNAPHMNGEQAATIAKLAGAKRLLLTHLNPTTDLDALLSQAQAVFPATAIVQEHEQYRV